MFYLQNQCFSVLKSNICRLCAMALAVQLALAGSPVRAEGMTPRHSAESSAATAAAPPETVECTTVDQSTGEIARLTLSLRDPSLIEACERGETVYTFLPRPEIVYPRTKPEEANPRPAGDDAP